MEILRKCRTNELLSWIVLSRSSRTSSIPSIWCTSRAPRRTPRARGLHSIRHRGSDYSYLKELRPWPPRRSVGRTGPLPLHAKPTRRRRMNPIRFIRILNPLPFPEAPPPPRRPMTIYAINGHRELAHDEWLYQVQNTGDGQTASSFYLFFIFDHVLADL